MIALGDILYPPDPETFEEEDQWNFPHAYNPLQVTGKPWGKLVESDPIQMDNLDLVWRYHVRWSTGVSVDTERLVKYLPELPTGEIRRVVAPGTQELFKLGDLEFDRWARGRIVYYLARALWRRNIGPADYCLDLAKDIMLELPDQDCG